jgi:hypothetical protein
MALYGVWPGEKAEEVKVFRNSWGGLTYIWESMAARYLGCTKSYSYPDKGWMQLAAESPSPLWDLWKSPHVPEEFRLVFTWGFDRFYLAKENYERMAKAIRSFLKAFPPKTENVNHWAAIADYLENIVHNPTPEEAPALGIYGTSCGDNVWHGDWDEEKEDYKPLDWEQFYEVCKEIDSLKEAVNGTKS